jgi:starch phosphorylase
MKLSMRFLCPVFNTNRMVHEYTTRFYQPAMERSARMAENGLQRARTLAAWKEKIRSNWNQIRVLRVEPKISGIIKVGDRFDVEARVRLGDLRPEDVLVQLYHGSIDAASQIIRGRAITLKFDRMEGDSISIFTGSCSCRASGLHGYALRILPFHEDMNSAFDLHLIHWAG